MTESEIFKKCFIENYKNSDKTIEEIKQILQQSDCNASEISAILETIIYYRKNKP
ncbi:MAG: hypothetical protein K2L12_06440 [Clostridia bacterium]|nr:hypothetical protein [Clostridia bacterium]